jgi:hypothetical protein
MPELDRRQRDFIREKFKISVAAERTDMRKRFEVKPRSRPVVCRANPLPSMAKRPPGISWRAHFRAAVGLGRV